MHEANWVARIIFSLIGVAVVGILVAGYIVGSRPVAQQHYEEAVSLPPG